MNKEDFSKKISLKKGFPLSLSKKIADDFFNILKDILKFQTLNLKNFGTFKLIKKNKRLGRNPKTKEEFFINARKSVSFTSSIKLSKKVNLSG